MFLNGVQRARTKKRSFGLPKTKPLVSRARLTGGVVLHEDVRARVVKNRPFVDSVDRAAVRRTRGERICRRGPAKIDYARQKP